mmetsp:Transcript_36857/g.115420  ORF Transcript_36857/g.115420 Transcript_36857/m.115420 type:complete len:135 (-) Transcript_36857:26-430(-)
MKSRGVCVLVLLIATWIASVCCSCWQPTRIVQAMCSSAENNTFPTYQLLQQQYSGARRLLWQGGGPASEDVRCFPLKLLLMRCFRFQITSYQNKQDFVETVGPFSPTRGKAYLNVRKHVSLRSWFTVIHISRIT